MAELRTNTTWEEPDPVTAVLRDSLPPEFIVVAAPKVYGHTIDVIVVGPQGLFVLYDKHWAGQIKPVWGGAWRVQTPAGSEGSFPNPAAEAQKLGSDLAGLAQAALHSVEPPAVHHLLVLSNPQAVLAPGAAPDMMVVTPANVVDVIIAMPMPGAGVLPDAETRRRLAHALQTHQVSPSQRLSQPFTFRSGALVGSGKQVWTLRDLVRHMDRHPEAGIYHLNNGTLAAWLDAQGAADLAELARDVLRRRENDPRVPLELFLIGSGLVERPRLRVRPARVNLGCVVAGAPCTGRIQVRRGRGRGYLFGAIAPSESWLRVDPHSFSDAPLQAVITVDTGTLPISTTAWQADLLISSSASEQPIAVPVQVRVSGQPAALSRYGLRPLQDALAAGLVGAGIGALLGIVGRLGTPDGSARPGLFWALVIGLVWALFGVVRGMGQRPAWTAAYATARYLAKIGLWLLSLALAAALGVLIWGAWSSQNGPALVSVAGLRVALLAMSLAIVPATLSEIRAARRASDTPLAAEGRGIAQPILAGLAVVMLVAVLAAGVRLAGPTWQTLLRSGAVDATSGWFDQRLVDLDRAAQRAIDRFYLWRYDRPGDIAPNATPAPTVPSSGASAP